LYISNFIIYKKVFLAIQIVGYDYFKSLKWVKVYISSLKIAYYYWVLSKLNYVLYFTAKILCLVWKNACKQINKYYYIIGIRYIEYIILKNIWSLKYNNNITLYQPTCFYPSIGTKIFPSHFKRFFVYNTHSSWFTETEINKLFTGCACLYYT